MEGRLGDVRENLGAFKSDGKALMDDGKALQKTIELKINICICYKLYCQKFDLNLTLKLTLKVTLNHKHNTIK